MYQTIQLVQKNNSFLFSVSGWFWNNDVCGGPGVRLHNFHGSTLAAQSVCGEGDGTFSREVGPSPGDGPISMDLCRS